MTTPIARIRAAVTLAGFAAGVVLVGCGSSSPTPSKANVAAAEAIGRRLASAPGVVRASANYNRSLTDSGSVELSLEVQRGADVGDLADAAIEVVWRSTIEPLTAIVAIVAQADDPAVHLIRHVSIDRDRSDLTRRYGPRP